MQGKKQLYHFDGFFRHQNMGGVVIFIVEKAINFDEWFMIALWFIPFRRGGEAARRLMFRLIEAIDRFIEKSLSLYVMFCLYNSLYTYVCMYIYIYMCIYIYNIYIYICIYIYIKYIIPRYPYHLFLSLYPDRHQACGPKAMRRRRLQAWRTGRHRNDQQFLWESYGNPMGIWWELYDLMGIIWWC